MPCHSLNSILYFNYIRPRCQQSMISHIHNSLLFCYYLPRSIKRWNSLLGGNVWRTRSIQHQQIVSLFLFFFLNIRQWIANAADAISYYDRCWCVVLSVCLSACLLPCVCVCLIMLINERATCEPDEVEKRRRENKKNPNKSNLLLWCLMSSSANVLARPWWCWWAWITK